MRHLILSAGILVGSALIAGSIQLSTVRTSHSHEGLRQQAVWLRARVEESASCSSVVEHMLYDVIADCGMRGQVVAVAACDGHSEMPAGHIDFSTDGSFNCSPMWAWQVEDEYRVNLRLIPIEHLQVHQR